MTTNPSPQPHPPSSASRQAVDSAALVEDLDANVSQAALDAGPPPSDDVPPPAPDDESSAAREALLRDLAAVARVLSQDDLAAVLALARRAAP
jgi:hypothetical protein